MKTTSLIALALAIVSHSSAQEKAVSEPELRIVSVYAKGTGQLSADSAIVQLSHSAEASQLTEAINQSLKAKENIRKQLTSVGISSKDIVFQNFSSSSERGRLTGRVKNHTVTSPIHITVKTEAQFAKIAVMVDADDKLTYLGRSAHISDAAGLQVKAAEDAVKNLKRKIALYESSFGVKLKLVSFGEVSQKQVEEGSSPLAFESASYSSSSRPRKSKVATAGYAYDGSITQSFGDQKTVVHVHGVYKIVEE